MKVLGLKLGLVSMAALMLANLASATQRWTGAAGTTDWTTGANWDGNAAPDGVENVYISANGIHGTAVLSTTSSGGTFGVGWYAGEASTLTITNTGSFSNTGTTTIGSEATAIGILNVSGGNFTSGDASTDDLILGNLGEGTLNLLNSSIVNAGDVYLGYAEGGKGTLTVDGSGSLLISSGATFVLGRNATSGGRIEISNGGEIRTSGTVYAGHVKGVVVTATVDGGDSAWNNTGLFYVGNSGAFTLRVANGGQVSSVGTAFLGALSDGEGIVTVSGNSSIWDSAGSLYVGRFGTGALTITNGATVNAANVYLGFEENSEGSATVAGSDSEWHSVNAFYVGRMGAAALYITNSGLVSVDGFVKINSDETGEECFIRMTSGGMLAINAAGIAGDTLADFMDLVQGTDQIQYLAGSDWVNISHGIEGVGYTLDTYTEGNITYRRLTVLTSPAFRLGSPFSDNMVLQQQSDVDVWGWADSGSTVTVTPSWTAAVASVADGNGEWRMTVPTPAGSTTQHTLTVHDDQGHSTTLTNVLVGEVWLCSGQSNMWWPLEDTDNGSNTIASANTNIRLFTVPHKISSEPLHSCGGLWRAADTNTLPDFSAVAYYFGWELYQELGVPIGLIDSSFGGTPAEAWTPLEAMARDTRLYPILDREIIGDKYEPAVLYHGMINPLNPYAMRGVIWYQGESNRARYEEYRTLFPALIKSWRYHWGQGDFPFYFVQLAPLTLDGEPVMKIPLLQEAQLYTMQTVPDTGMAVTTDIGNINDVHPRNKLDVGKRLSYWALANTYGQSVLFSGPIYKEMVVEGNQARIFFDHDAGGLTSNGTLDDFIIAGSNMVFYPATATIESNSVVVSSASVTVPAAVRYCWKNEAEGNLYNINAALPASPFRTDTDELYDTSSVAPASVFGFGL